MPTTSEKLDQLIKSLQSIFSLNNLDVPELLIQTAYAHYLCLIPKPVDAREFASLIKAEMKVREGPINLINFAARSLGIFPFRQTSRTIPYKGHIIRALVYQAGKGIPEEGCYISGPVAIAKLRGDRFVERLMYFESSFFEIEDEAIERSLDLAKSAINKGQIAI